MAPEFPLPPLSLWFRLDPGFLLLPLPRLSPLNPLVPDYPLLPLILLVPFHL